MLLNGGLGDISLDPRHMKDNEAFLALNTDFRREEGALHASKDNKLFSALLSDNIDSLSTYRNRLVVHSGDNLYWNDLENVSRADFLSDFPADFEKYDGNLYALNGKEFLKFDGSTWSTPLISAPSKDDIVATEVDDGNLEEGKFQYRFTLVQAASSGLKLYDREESPPSEILEKTTSAANKNIAFTVLPAPEGFNLVIYRRQVTGDTVHNEFRRVTIVAEETTTFTDDKIYWDLNVVETLRTEDYFTPPVGKHLSLLNNNFFMSGITSWNNTDPIILDNRIMWCDNARPGGWNKFFMATIGNSDDSLVNHLPLGKAVICYTRKTIERIAGRDADSYEPEKTFADVGLAAEWALTDTITFGHLFLASDRSLKLFDGFRIRESALMAMDGLFSKDSEYPYRMNWDARETCRMEFFNKMGYFIYPAVGSDTPNKVLYMDFKLWPKIRFHIGDWSATAIYEDAINNLLYIGESGGDIRQVGEDLHYLPVTYQTKDVDGGDIHMNKFFGKVRTDYDSAGKPLNLELFKDGNSVRSLELSKNGRDKNNSSYVTFPISSQGHRASLKYSWDEPDNDVTIFDVAIEMPKVNRT
jgi:hypothetical protein